MSRSLGRKAMALLCLSCLVSFGALFLVTKTWQQRLALARMDAVQRQLSGTMKLALDAAMVSPADSGREATVDGLPQYVYLKSFANEPRCAGCHGNDSKILGTMVLLRDLSPDWSALRTQGWVLAGISLLGMGLLLALMGVFIQRGISRPLAGFQLEAGAGGTDFGAFMEAHLKWKIRLTQACAGVLGETLDPAAIALDDRCDLGRWIHGPGQALAGHPEFRPLVADHAAFHRCAGKVAGLCGSGQREAAEALLAGTEFNDLTRAVVTRLRHLETDA